MSKSCQVCKKLDHHGLDVTYHLIPRDPVRRQIWSALLGFPKEKVLPKYSYICSRHFHKSDFHYKRNGIKYLNADAQPLLVNSNVFEPQQGSDEETESASLSFGGVSSSFKISLEEESEPDVPDLVPVHQPTDVDESTEVEIKEEPLKRENDLPTSDIHEEPSSDIYEESTSDIHEESTSDIHEEPPTLPLLPIIKEEPLDQPANISPETVEPQKKVEQISELGRQSIQMFFDSMAKTVMTLPPSFVSRIKSEVLRVVSNMEMEAIGEQMKEPIRTPKNLTAASTVTEPRIKIENVDDEEAEASDELDQPELLDPESLDLDHDENYEPLAKKKKKSQADQPTPSSSALQVRTPRTQHEPVETFFQSVACTVTSFPRPFVCKAKVAVLKVISKMEVEVCSSRQLGYQDGGGGGDGSSTRHLLASGSNY